MREGVSDTPETKRAPLVRVLTKKLKHPNVDKTRLNLNVRKQFVACSAALALKTQASRRGNDLIVGGVILLRVVSYHGIVVLSDQLKCFSGGWGLYCALTGLEIHELNEIPCASERRSFSMFL